MGTRDRYRNVSDQNADEEKLIQKKGNMDKLTQLKGKNGDCPFTLRAWTAGEATRVVDALDGGAT